MRTTLTLDPDVAKRLETEIRRRGTSLKEAINAALRVGLGMTDKPVRPKRFVLKPSDIGVRPGVDLDRMNQLVDDLDAEATAAKLRK